MFKRKIDYPLVIIIFILIVFGLIMISSVSVYESYKKTLEIANATLDPTDGPRNDFYLWRHLINLVMAIPLWIGVSFIPYTFWKKHASLFFGFSIFLMLLLFTPLGVTYKGATGWLDVPLLPSIQPVEVMKLGMIIYVARWLVKRDQALQTFQDGFLPFSLLIGGVLALIAMQPDFGAILVLAPVCVALYFVGGGNMKHMLVAFLISLVFASIVVATVPYINSRFELFINPDVDANSKNIGWQIQQSLIAVGSGGLTGLGLGKSIQKFGYLPEVQGDVIFSAIGEETGFIGTMILIALYVVIAFRGFKVAQHAPDRFSMLLATGITSWIVWQAFVNVAVTIQLLPLTGITLPFISYGGTSLLLMCFAAGILTNISSYANTPNTKTNFTHRRRNRRPHHA